MKTKQYYRNRRADGATDEQSETTTTTTTTVEPTVEETEAKQPEQNDPEKVFSFAGITITHKTTKVLLLIALAVLLYKKIK